MIRLKTIGQIVKVELLKHHQFLYKRDKIDAVIENNWSYCRIGTAG